jgi:aminoglycoside phosphotransferase (APT) family kinase protein
VIELEHALGGSVAALRRLSGGASRITSSFELRGTRGTRRLVLQEDRATVRAAGGGVAVEAALLRAAATARVPVPGVVATGSWASSGRGWLVVERLEGETIPRRLLRDDRWSVARAGLTAQCGAALAALHRIDTVAVAGLAPTDPIHDPLGVLDTLGETRPVLELGVRWLRLHPCAPSGPTTVHGDFRLGNLLVGEDGLRGVLDWELAHVGDPAEDLGWLCARSWRFGGRGRVGGFGELPTLLEAYRDHGGARIDETSVTWWEAWAAVRWAAICAMQASAHLSGASPSVELAAIGRRVCESEWDLLLVLGMVDADTTAGAPAGAGRPDAPFGRPSAAELVAAVGAYLDARTERSGDEGERFESRVARNVVGIVERELQLGAAARAAHEVRLAELGATNDVVLAASVRGGAFDDDLARVGRVLSRSTREQLAIANPTYAQEPAD